MENLPVLDKLMHRCDRVIGKRDKLGSTIAEGFRTSCRVFRYRLLASLCTDRLDSFSRWQDLATLLSARLTFAIEFDIARSLKVRLSEHASPCQDTYMYLCTRNVEQSLPYCLNNETTHLVVCLRDVLGDHVSHPCYSNM